MTNFIIRRTLLLIPTLFLISLISFAIITLPPGDYLTAYMQQLSQTGVEVDQATIQNLRTQYGLNQPWPVQYYKWVEGFFHGDFGYSFQLEEPVLDIISRRIGFTVILSLATLLFQWILAIPIGIYSAVKQYSLFDYFFTFFGFIGLSIPNFLLALILMFIGFNFFGVNVGGLLSAKYIGASWSFAKVMDLLTHLWIPIVVVGTAGMAGLIRIVRGQMLDELGKQYMRTARSKGVPEWKAILKYPTRLAINPVISRAAVTIPKIVSRGTIAGIVLGLPILGPTLMTALRSQDMYLGGTIILMQSTLVVITVFLSDLLLAVVDPRIKYD